VEALASAPLEYPVGSAIQEYLEKGGLSRIAQFRLMADVWDDVVGEEVAMHCRPLRLDGDDLVIEVDHRGWITELSFRQQVILQGLQERVGRAVARRLKVTLSARSGVE